MHISSSNCSPFSVKNFCLLALLCLVPLAAPATAADVPLAAWSGDTEQLQADGWVETAPGVYTRTSNGNLQTLAYGDAGPRLELGWIESQIELLNESFALSGSVDVALALQDLEQRRDDLVDEMRRGARRQAVGETSLLSTDVSGSDLTLCSPQATVSATAAPISTGPQAAASTSYSDSCGQTASVYCYSFARGYDGFVYNDGTQADGPRNVTGSGSCSVSKTVQADNNCFATSTAQVNFTDDNGDPVTYLERNSTNKCSDFEVTISSTNVSPDPDGNYTINLTVDECTAVFWEATSTRSGTTYAWTHDSADTGTGSTYTTFYCYDYNLGGSSALHTLELVGTEGSSTTQDTVTIEVFHEEDFTTDPGTGGGGGEPINP